MIFALQQVQLDKDDEGVNIFVLDWAQAAQPPYNQAVVNIELLGIFVAKVMIELEVSISIKQ
jgi:hypothetical protein